MYEFYFSKDATTADSRFKWYEFTTSICGHNWKPAVWNNDMHLSSEIMDRHWPNALINRLLDTLSSQTLKIVKMNLGSEQWRKNSKVVLVSEIDLKVEQTEVD